MHEHRTAAEWAELRAEYERRYGRYEGVAQPRLTGTSLRVEIHPQRRVVEIRGTPALVNHAAAAIDSIHVHVPRVPGLVARFAAGPLAVMSTRLQPVSNAKAKAELGWQPRHPSWRDGFRAELGSAAQSR